MRFAPKEGLALINGTTGMTAFAALLWVDAWRVLRALLGAVALAIEALEAPSEPYRPWVHESKGHPGQIAVAAHVLALIDGSGFVTESYIQRCYSLRCVPQGLGPGLGSAGCGARRGRTRDQFGQRQSVDRSRNRQDIPRRQLLWRPHLPAAGHVQAGFRD